jgi:hypothetical protein
LVNICLAPKIVILLTPLFLKKIYKHPLGVCIHKIIPYKIHELSKIHNLFILFQLSLLQFPLIKSNVEKSHVDFEEITSCILKFLQQKIELYPQHGCQILVIHFASFQSY